MLAVSSSIAPATSCTFSAAVRAAPATASAWRLPSPAAAVSVAAAAFSSAVAHRDDGVQHRHGVAEQRLHRRARGLAAAGRDMRRMRLAAARPVAALHPAQRGTDGRTVEFGGRGTQRAPDRLDPAAVGGELLGQFPRQRQAQPGGADQHGGLPPRPVPHLPGEQREPGRAPRLGIGRADAPRQPGGEGEGLLLRGEHAGDVVAQQRRVPRLARLRHGRQRGRAQPAQRRLEPVQRLSIAGQAGEPPRLGQRGVAGGDVLAHRRHLLGRGGAGRDEERVEEGALEVQRLGQAQRLGQKPRVLQPRLRVLPAPPLRDGEHRCGQDADGGAEQDGEEEDVADAHANGVPAAMGSPLPAHGQVERR
jgi:hypothetical protein